MAGLDLMVLVAPPARAAGSATRSIECAYLKGNNGVGPFLAVVVHTDCDKGPATEASGVAFAQALSGWVTRVNASRGMVGTPVIMMADLNSYGGRQPNGAQKVLTNSGWVDSFGAKVRTSVQYPTINANPANGNNGFPAVPFTARPNKKNPEG